MSAASIEVAGFAGTWDALSGDVATLTLPKAFAPGAPLSIRARLGEREVTVAAKTVNSKKRGESFEVTARLYGLTRETRPLVTDFFAPRP